MYLDMSEADQMFVLSTVPSPQSPSPNAIFRQALQHTNTIHKHLYGKLVMHCHFSEAMPFFSFSPNMYLLFTSTN